MRSSARHVGDGGGRARGLHFGRPLDASAAIIMVKQRSALDLVLEVLHGKGISRISNACAAGTAYNAIPTCSRLTISTHHLVRGWDGSVAVVMAVLKRQCEVSGVHRPLSMSRPRIPADGDAANASHVEVNSGLESTTQCLTSHGRVYSAGAIPALPGKVTDQERVGKEPYWVMPTTTTLVEVTVPLADT
jgi:hypothetical protein